MNSWGSRGGIGARKLVLTLEAFFETIPDEPGSRILASKRKGLLPVIKNIRVPFVFAVSVVLVGCSQAPAPAPVAQTHGVGSIVRLDPAFDALVPKDAVIEKVGGGFQFTEGPLWRPEGTCGSAT